jgi:lipoprotein-anchoring transpeptidase ErfK/SrfK
MRIQISIKNQTLTLIDHQDAVMAVFVISSAKKGAGCKKNSYCTPIGNHIIRAKIGAGAAPNTVFKGRRPTGEIFADDLIASYPNRDWILTRILWLSGTEVGKNRLGNVDTMQRYVYIHGSPKGVEMGKPGSHGCIRMQNADVIALFNLVPVGTPVNITED